MLPNPQETADLVTFTEEILNGKLHFCAVYSVVLISNLRILSTSKEQAFYKARCGDHFLVPLHLRSLFPSYRSSRPEVFCNKDVYFAKFIGKQPCWSLF